MNRIRLLTILAIFLVIATGCTSTSSLGLAKADHVDAIYEEQLEMVDSIKELQLIRSDNVEYVQELLSEMEELSSSNALIVEANQLTDERMKDIEEQLAFLPTATLKELVMILATHLDLEISETQQEVGEESPAEESQMEAETPAG